MATGLMTSGSEAKRRTSNPAGTVNFLCASAGGKGAVLAGAYWPVSCRPAARISLAVMSRPSKQRQRILIAIPQSKKMEIKRKLRLPKFSVLLTAPKGSFMNYIDSEKRERYKGAR